MIINRKPMNQTSTKSTYAYSPLKTKNTNGVKLLRPYSAISSYRAKRFWAITITIANNDDTKQYYFREASRTASSKSGNIFLATEAKSKRSENNCRARSPISDCAADDMANHCLRATSVPEAVSG